MSLRGVIRGGGGFNATSKGDSNKGKLGLKRKLDIKRGAAAKKRATSRKKWTREELINAESALGRTIFGPIPEGRRREFFHHQKNVWIWHESWSEQGRRREQTVRYEVRKDGVYKRWGRSGYVQLSGKELENFQKAAKAYLKIIKEKLYN